MTQQQFRLTVKGQVTIPKDVRDELGLEPGVRVAFDREDGKIVIRKGEPDRDEAGRYRDMMVRIAEARRIAKPLIDMTADDVMALVREPVPGLERG